MHPYCLAIWWLLSYTAAIPLAAALPTAIDVVAPFVPDLVTVNGIVAVNVSGPARSRLLDTRSLLPYFVPDLVTVNGIVAVNVSGLAKTKLLEARSLVPRVGRNDGSSMTNAIDIFIDCTGQLDNCDQDTAAMLCLNKPNMFRKNAAVHDDNYGASGAEAHVFARSRTEMARIGVDRPPTPNNGAGEMHSSAEEFPFEGTEQGGRDAWLFPVQLSQQHVQGNRIRNAYSHAHVHDGLWFRIEDFLNCNMRYCVAWRTNDISKCEDPRTDGLIDWLNYARQKISPPNARLKFAPSNYEKVMQWIDRGGSNGGSNV